MFEKEVGVCGCFATWALLTALLRAVILGKVCADFIISSVLVAADQTGRSSLYDKDAALFS